MKGVAALLLAAGKSSRMGQLKALLPWKDTTLLQYQVDSLRLGGASQVIVVLGHRAEALRPLIVDISGVLPVLNLRYNTGRASSVRAGLRELNKDTEIIMVLSVDQPRSPDLIARVLKEHRKFQSLVTYPIYNGNGGHPTIFAASLLPELMKIRDSRLGLREVVGRYAGKAHCFEINDKDALLDLNRPEDYEMAVRTGLIK
jgi:molybdenum cofactor cytidylyltransferase